LIDRGGYSLVLLNLILLAFSVVFLNIAAPVFAATTLFTVYFFRDPPRAIGEGIVSPADGKIDYIKGNRLEIFMGPFDCHVNRSPVSGKVVKVEFRKGKKPPAFIRHENVCSNEIVISGEEGTFRVIQMAGIFARRIVCYVNEGDFVKKGDKIGIIRFGSRVVVELPDGFKFIRKVGEKVKAGETIALRDEDT
jgi:phosphatidylserine decarboxylase